ncbi:hypothetical protein KKC83_01155 [Patescibacteria group bacterium]|nr:hypothetical protein [Candidatus Falkowbacteria bacterium]MBU3905756.1 hypothetical protein [Patescibacteria group bacterium]MBU4015824.1 hypothetical protein [Patescibacteria group bacterium]MBU4026138.1 hypothetical protein [Patescibacteria group bacterium]MBU4072853.1 hypothetical protein [Patescibacteria group bacterium]
MKKIIIVAIVIIIFVGGIFYFLNNRQAPQTQEQAILESTLNISREYAALRYRTDNVLINAKNYADYDAWSSEMTDIIKNWEALGKEAIVLENLANKMAEEKVSLKFVETVQAYTKEEITNIVDKAPMGRKIRTLAQFLGVDAKMAQLVLNQSQDEISREAYGEEGDVFQTCENRATVVKNASKVTVFVGTIALTGGTAAIASGGTFGQVAVIVSGADLTLEITDDTAKMALGDKNKISSIVGDVRKITEPAAAILMVATLPTNLVLGIDKLNAVTFGAEQLNSTIQSGSVIGIKLPTPTKEKPEPATEVSVLEKEEVNEWMKEQGVTNDAVTVEEIENILGVNQPAESANASENSAQTEVSKIKVETQKEQSHTENNNSVGGTTWAGVLQNTAGGSQEVFTHDWMITFNQDGTISSPDEKIGLLNWKKEGSMVILFGENTSLEFQLAGNTLTFSKMIIGGEHIYSGQEFMGGIAFSGSLIKQ